MEWIGEIWRRLRAVVRRRQNDRDLDEEMRLHLELRAEEQMKIGVAADDARSTAQLRFGNALVMKERSRDVWGWHWLETFLHDLRYGARMLRRSPAFTGVAILSLAIGIGANTAIFSVIENVVLRPLLFAHSDRLVRFFATKEGAVIQGFSASQGPSALDMQDFTQTSHSFEQTTLYDIWRKNVSFGDLDTEPEQMFVGLIPRSYFQVLEVQPMMGRLFAEDECQNGRDHVAAISAQLWKNRFNTDAGILGRKIRINAEPYTIVSVMPDVIPQWMEARDVQVWTPYPFCGGWTEASRGNRGFGALARLRPGVSAAKAQADLNAIAMRLAATFPVDQGMGVLIETLSETRMHDLRPILLLLTVAVGLILLIACVNVANLLLARNSVRERELALRGALGAARGRLVGQLLAETLLLALLGGVVGLLLAEFAVTRLIQMQPPNWPPLASAHVDWKLLLFTLAVSVLTSLLFGVGPAVIGSRGNVAEGLKTGSRSLTSVRGAQRVGSALVVTEMAMSLTLLVCAGLLIQSTLRLEGQQLGIRQEQVLTGHFFLPTVRYPNADAITRFADDLGMRVRAIPGVIDATVTTVYPPYNGWTQMLRIPGYPATRIQDIPTAQFGVTDVHFRKALGIPLIRGRDFAISDTEATRSVALISEQFQRRYFPQEDPVGREIHIGPPAFMHIPPGGNTSDASDVTIVGVIGDFKNIGLSLPPQPQLIVLYAQHPLVNYGFKDIAIRTASDPHSMIPEIARQLHTVDPDMPFAQVRTIDEIVGQQTGSQRFTALLLGLFAAAGLILAAVGTYGVVSFLVAQRRRELAIRLAVGASIRNILWLVLGRGLWMAAVGASIGLAGAAAASKLISGLLFGISAVDPLTFAAAAVFLLLMVLLACWGPAWRSARVDPVIALRAE